MIFGLVWTGLAPQEEFFNINIPSIHAEMNFMLTGNRPVEISEDGVSASVKEVADSDTDYVFR